MGEVDKKYNSYQGKEGSLIYPTEIHEDYINYNDHSTDFYESICSDKYFILVHTDAGDKIFLNGKHRINYLLKKM